MRLLERFMRLTIAALAAAVSPAGAADDPPFATSVNAHRARVLFEGDARAVWVGDSWAILDQTHRLPYGSILVWPVGELGALSGGYSTGGLVKGEDFTSGDGALEQVNQTTRWRVEVDSTGRQRYFGLPVNDMSRVAGEPGLVLDGDWAGPARVQGFRVRNNLVAAGELGPFSAADDQLRARLLYYATHDLSQQAERIGIAERDGSAVFEADLHLGARPFWSDGGDPDADPAGPAALGQINAIAPDIEITHDLDGQPGLVMTEPSAPPLVGSRRYWQFAGSVVYRAGEDGAQEPGYYHSGLATESWSFERLAADRESTGGKHFTNEQLLRWLDVTTLNRSQPPVVILHLATEPMERGEVESRTLEIIDRFRWAFGEIGTSPPMFLLVGSYLHRLDEVYQEGDRASILALNRAYERLAATEPDCAFVSLYALTDGMYFTTEWMGGSGTNQASRDWLDANGWSTITYGGETYTLSSDANGGLDGVLLRDGLHISAEPAAAFFARLLADEILSAPCPGDLNGDGATDTRDVLAFLNAWAAGDSEADYNGDGVVNTIDVLAFLNAWTVGCDG